ncbi:MAG: primosome assembly protein PriA [Propionibacteriaceae bacterium]|jgi:primosomal protein N' (replication factor Y)|nr:primosome assembly protein PriA [Propionibacteriaceae bacterium]
MAAVIARIYVDVPLPHLDRPFDYAVPPALADQVQPGVRVRVRFAGRLVDGWVVEVTDQSEVTRLSPIERLISPEVVVPAASRHLIRAVADHYGGSFCDVARLAVPPRHAATERAVRAAELKAEESGSEPAEFPTDRHSSSDAPAVAGAKDSASTVAWTASPLDGYPQGTDYLTTLAAGGQPRASWTVVPVADRLGDWADGLAAAAAACLASGRSAVLIVPDAKDCDRLQAAVERRIDRRLVVRQTASLGPAARYRGFLRALHGQARVVVGTPAAAYAPVVDCGLVAMWDDGDDSYVGRLAPYPQVRDVVALRVAEQRAAVLYAGYGQSTELAGWLEAGWLRPISAPTNQRRRSAPRTQIASQSERADEFDPAARTARLPHDVFRTVRDGLAAGPVLVHVPFSGLGRHLFCQSCRGPVRCSCGGPLAEVGVTDRRAEPAPAGPRTRSAPAGPRAETGTARSAEARQLACDWCGQKSNWTCPVCRSTRYRAATVGHRRTAQELARAFPEVTVLRSDGDEPLLTVPDEPALVIATPGVEPVAEAGYAAAVIVDAAASLGRPSLWAAEEALRRWLAVVSLVRPAAEGGTAIIVGPADDRTVQAWLRLDPAGFASRELADRRVAGFPPAVRMASVRGESAAIDQITAELATEDRAWVEQLGPVPTADETGSRLLLRTSLAHGRQLARLVHDLAAARSAAKAAGAVSWQLDPRDLR